MERVILGLKFVNEGSYAPEQYDVFDDIGIIAYVRYRYGKLCVEYPWVNGDEIIYEEIGGRYQGAFVDEEERTNKLNEVAKTIVNFDNERKQQDDYSKFRVFWNKEFDEFMEKYMYRNKVKP